MIVGHRWVSCPGDRPRSWCRGRSRLRQAIELTGTLTPDDLTRRCRTTSSPATASGARARTGHPRPRA